MKRVLKIDDIDQVSLHLKMLFQDLDLLTSLILFLFQNKVLLLL